MDSFEYLSTNKQQRKMLMVKEEQVFLIFVLEKDFEISKNTNIKDIQHRIKRYQCEMTSQMKVKLGMTPSAILAHLKDCRSWQLHQDQNKNIFFDIIRRSRKTSFEAKLFPQTFKDIGKQKLQQLILQHIGEGIESPIKNKQPAKLQKSTPEKPPKFQQSEIDDAKYAANEYVKLDKARKQAYIFQGARVRKSQFGKYDDIQINLLGKNSLKHVSSFKIKINKLTKQFRNPAIWIGFASQSLPGQFTIDKCQKDNVIAMSDKKSLFKLDTFHVMYQQEPESIDFKYFEHQFEAGDIIQVKANLNTGQITWSDNSGKQFGSYLCEEIKSNEVDWVPYVELWKTGDQIQWLK